MPPCTLRPSALLLVALLQPACVLHHVRDEAPLAIKLGGEPASVAVEKAATARGGQRLLVTVEHPDFIDLEGAIGTEAELGTPEGTTLDTCRRQSYDRDDLGGRRRRSRLLFLCRWPLLQEAVLRTTEREAIPVLGRGGQQVMGAQPWLLSTWVRGELGARVTGVAETQGVDLGINFGARGVLRSHWSVGGRADALVDTRRGQGQFLVGPQGGYLDQGWPCARCSVEANLSYVIGYARGFAHGPEADVHLGLRLARTGTTWHGIEAGAGYRHLLGPESGGSVVLMLSYTLQTAIRSWVLPQALRAQERQLKDEERSSPRSSEEEGH